MELQTCLGVDVLVVQNIAADKDQIVQRTDHAVHTAEDEIDDHVDDDVLHPAVVVADDTAPRIQNGLSLLEAADGCVDVPCAGEDENNAHTLADADHQPNDGGDGFSAGQSLGYLLKLVRHNRTSKNVVGLVETSRNNYTTAKNPVKLFTAGSRIAHKKFTNKVVMVTGLDLYFRLWRLHHSLFIQKTLSRNE